ncbi:isoprenoid synthase domain-containing protein, partial [Mycena olivaceomarginata]
SSVLHDDIIDASALRRGAPSAATAFGNKLAIFGGDFLLGRTPEVVDLIAVIAGFVEGEIFQMKDIYCTTKPTGGSNVWTIYLKTTSLMAKGCHASVILTQGEA